MIRRKIYTHKRVKREEPKYLFLQTIISGAEKKNEFLPQAIQTCASLNLAELNHSPNSLSRPTTTLPERRSSQPSLQPDRSCFNLAPLAGVSLGVTPLLLKQKKINWGSGPVTTSPILFVFPTADWSSLQHRTVKTFRQAGNGKETHN